MCSEFDGMLAAWLIYFVGASLVGAWIQAKIDVLTKLKVCEDEPDESE